MTDANVLTADPAGGARIIRGNDAVPIDVECPCGEVAYLPDSAAGRRFYCTCGNVIAIAPPGAAQPDEGPPPESRRSLIRRVGGEAGIVGVIVIVAVVLYVCNQAWTFIELIVRDRESARSPRRQD